MGNLQRSPIAVSRHRPARARRYWGRRSVSARQTPPQETRDLVVRGRTAALRYTAHLGIVDPIRRGTVPQALDPGAGYHFLSGGARPAPQPGRIAPSPADRLVGRLSGRAGRSAGDGADRAGRGARAAASGSAGAAGGFRHGDRRSRPGRAARPVAVAASALLRLLPRPTRCLPASWAIW